MTRLRIPIVAPPIFYAGAPLEYTVSYPQFGRADGLLIDDGRHPCDQSTALHADTLSEAETLKAKKTEFEEKGASCPLCKVTNNGILESPAIANCGVARTPSWHR